MMWQPCVDHGQKHDPGDEIIVHRELTIKGPLQKYYSRILSRFLPWQEAAMVWCVCRHRTQFK